MELDLSFATIENDKQANKRKDTETKTGLDLSFIAQPKPPEPDRSLKQKISDVFTGDDRETEATRTLPEFDLPMFHYDDKKGVLQNIGDNIGRQVDLAQTAVGFLTTFKPEQQAKILVKQFPDLKFESDEKGNIIVDGAAYGGEKGVLNLPGMSMRDIIQAGGQVLAFTPAGRAGQGVATIGGAVARVGAASAATQAVQSAASQSVGRDASTGEVVTEVGLAGGIGGGIEGAFRVLAPIAKQLVQNYRENKGITDVIREKFREAAQGAGLRADEITDNTIKNVLRDIDDATNPDAALNEALAREFNIPLTRGQRAADQAQLSFEDSARAGMLGNKAQKQMLNFENAQTQAVNSSADDLAARLSNNADIATPAEAGDRIINAVQQGEQSASSAVNNAYQFVPDASITPEGFKGLTDAVKRSMNDIEFDQTLPETNKLLQVFNNIEEVVANAGADISPQHIKTLEQIRRRINTAISSAKGANNADFRQVQIMKRTYDTYLDDAVEKALFTGDDAALDALKNARSISADYFKKFAEQPSKRKTGMIPDPAGKFIERIVADDVTAQEVINAFFGAAKLTNKKGAEKLADRVRAIVDDEAWNSLKQAAFLRLVQTTPVNGQAVISGSKTLSAINKAIETNRGMLNKLYTPTELATIRRWAVAVKRTQPDLVRSRENPSGTAQKTFKGIAQIMQRLTFLGGGADGLIVSAGVNGGIALSNAAKTAQAVKPFSAVIIPKGQGAVIGLTNQEAN